MCGDGDGKLAPFVGSSCALVCLSWGVWARSAARGVRVTAWGVFSAVVAARRCAVKSMDNTLIPGCQEAYVTALAFPANEKQPLLWWEVANLYVAYGSYDGAIVIFNRIVVDFADYDKISCVLMARAATLRRRRCVSGCGMYHMLSGR